VQVADYAIVVVSTDGFAPGEHDATIYTGDLAQGFSGKATSYASDGGWMVGVRAATLRGPLNVTLSGED
jgi:hypothetical protein